MHNLNNNNKNKTVKILVWMSSGFIKGSRYEVERVSGSPGIKNMGFRSFSFTKKILFIFLEFCEFFQIFSRKKTKTMGSKQKLTKVIRFDGCDQSQQIKQQGMGSKVKQVDRVDGTGARTLGLDSSQHADPGVQKRTVLKPLKGSFLRFSQTFSFSFFFVLFFFFYFLEKEALPFLQNSDDRSLFVPPSSGGVSDPIQSRSKALDPSFSKNHFVFLETKQIFVDLGLSLRFLFLFCSSLLCFQFLSLVLVFANLV